MFGQIWEALTTKDQYDEETDTESSPLDRAVDTAATWAAAVAEDDLEPVASSSKPAWSLW